MRRRHVTNFVLIGSPRIWWLLPPRTDEIPTRTLGDLIVVPAWKFTTFPAAAMRTCFPERTPLKWLRCFGSCGGSNDRPVGSLKTSQLALSSLSTRIGSESAASLYEAILAVGFRDVVRLADQSLRSCPCLVRERSRRSCGVLPARVGPIAVSRVRSACERAGVARAFVGGERRGDPGAP